MIEGQLSLFPDDDFDEEQRLDDELNCIIGKPGGKFSAAMLRLMDLAVPTYYRIVNPGSGPNLSDCPF